MESSKYLKSENTVVVDEYDHLPIINISSLAIEAVHSTESQKAVEQIGAACRKYGFFYIKGHGVSPELEYSLEQEALRFFSLPLEVKESMAMRHGGRAWRGWFPVGQELTSGLPDQKEGIYFGEELAQDHPLVMNKIPFHGANIFPNQEFKNIVIKWMEEMRRIGHIIMRGIALSLGLEVDRFDRHGMNDPLQLFRIFRYPVPTSTEYWGVGEHTDYGVLTILKQDRCGGLEVKKPDSQGGHWIAAPPIDGTFIINIGDMLEKMTCGQYVSTPHRVQNSTDQARMSFPYFFDPNYFAELSQLEGISPRSSSTPRWDHEDIHQIDGIYGNYLLSKVGKVFPELFGQIHFETTKF